MNRLPTVCTTLALTFTLAACAGYGTGPSEPESGALEGAAKAQFDCANRNGNEYIDSAELVFLVQCGVSEGQPCGHSPADGAEAPSSQQQFRQGRRLLEIMDLNLDRRISKLEFRAFCNQGR